MFLKIVTMELKYGMNCQVELKILRAYSVFQFSLIHTSTIANLFIPLQ